MKNITLTQGKFAICDDIDYEFLNRLSWCFDGKYAQTRSRGPAERMHVLVFERMTGRRVELIEHFNELDLDNRRENLKESNKSYNGLNRKAKGFTITSAGHYRAQLSIKGVRVLDKVFMTQEAAVNAYNNAKYTYLNEPRNVT